MTRVLFALALCLPFLVQSQPYPTKPVRLIVTYPAGGGADTMARLISPRLGEALGGEIVASSPADLGAWVREQTASWAKVVRAANIKPE